MGPILFVFSLWLLHANGQEDGDAISALQKSADYDVKSMKSEAVQTFPSHADARYKVHPGRYMVEGSDILQADMNLTRASWLCNKIATCVGFTFEGSSVDGEGSDEEDHKVHRVHFKSKFETFAGDWTSYEKLSPGAGVQKSQDITVPIPVPRELRQGSSSSPSGQSQTISFTCLTETYLGKGNDLQAVRMLPQLAPDFCARLQYGNRPCVGWTWHGANGTMSNQNVLGSPFFDETKVVYFKFRQRPGSSARWASCITINGQGGGLGQGANLIADTETQSRPVSLKAETHQEKEEATPTSPWGQGVQGVQGADAARSNECHMQGTPRRLKCPVRTRPRSGSSSTGIANSNRFKTIDITFDDLPLVQEHKRKLATFIQQNEHAQKCLQEHLQKEITLPIDPKDLNGCLRPNSVTPCAYKCIYEEVCGGEGHLYGRFVECRNDAIEHCHRINQHDSVEECTSTHDQIVDDCYAAAHRLPTGNLTASRHEPEFQFQFCNSNFPLVRCPRNDICKANPDDRLCLFEACGNNPRTKEKNDEQKCDTQTDGCHEDDEDEDEDED